MGWPWVYYCLAFIVVAVAQSPVRTADESKAALDNLEQKATSFLKNLDKRGSKECTKAVIANWNFATDINDRHKEEKAEAQLAYAAYNEEVWKSVKEWDGQWQKLSDPFLKRQFKFLSVLGTAALPKDDLKKFNSLVTDMSTIYSTATICGYKKKPPCTLSLEPEIENILQNSRDYNELEHVWKMWRSVSGRRMKDKFKEFVELANKAAKLNGFDNMGDMWIYPYESDTFRDDVKALYNQLKPLYQQMHAYVRRKLREYYGEERVSRRGPIPAHLFGNMWSQSWSEIYNILIPYPNKASVDVTPQMLEQGYNQVRMFELSDEFFKSINLTGMPPEFWEHSVIEKPQGRDLICHASAWDFCNGKDFRIKQCTQVTMKDLIIVHHEMGHIQYYLQYKHQPEVFRSGANPGFHEAVGDVLALSVATPKHLHKIGLLDQVEESYEEDINFLMRMALSKVAFLPFGYLIDLWRWDVFSGKLSPTGSDWNCAWWKMRVELQGIRPPMMRDESDFDPGAKYHVPASVPYIRYFVSYVLQFQFHKAMCMKAGQYDPTNNAMPLHKCDIFNSTEAGHALGDMLQLGRSKEWPDALEQLTGTRKMDATVLREYFKPLEMWLKEDNEKHGEYIGWTTDKFDEYCSSKAKEGSTTDGTIDGASCCSPTSLVVMVVVALLYLFQ